MGIELLFVPPRYQMMSQRDFDRLKRHLAKKAPAIAG
jgi:hypothetical protein